MRVDEADARLEQIGLLRTGSGRQLQRDDLLEQPGFNGAESEWTPFDALPREGGVEGRASVACARYPGSESAGSAFTAKCMSEKPSPLKWLASPRKSLEASARRFNCVVMPFIV